MSFGGFVHLALRVLHHVGGGFRGGFPESGLDFGDCGDFYEAGFETGARDGVGCRMRGEIGRFAPGERSVAGFGAELCRDAEKQGFQEPARLPAFFEAVLCFAPDAAPFFVTVSSCQRVQQSRGLRPLRRSARVVFVDGRKPNLVDVTGGAGGGVPGEAIQRLGFRFPGGLLVKLDSSDRVGVVILVPGIHAFKMAQMARNEQRNAGIERANLRNSPGKSIFSRLGSKKRIGGLGLEPRNKNAIRFM